MQWDEPHPSLYDILNQRLRSKNRATLIPWFLFLKLFFTALYKLPSFKGTIWRSVRGNLTDQYDENQIWWGVSSCTETMKIMERFVGRDGVRTIFNIESINGKAIRDHSYFNEENEILLMPGTYLQVVDKWTPAKDLYMKQSHLLFIYHHWKNSQLHQRKRKFQVVILHHLNLTVSLFVIFFIF
jgi:hypothetical protein